MDAKVLGGQEFDVSPTGPEPAEVGKTIARCLAVRGFCRINPDIKQDLLEQALRDVQEADAQLRFRRPCAEFREGLLGEAGSWRIAELALPSQPEESAKTNSARAGGPGVQALDRLLSIVQATAEPLFPSVLGFDAPHRTAGLLHEVSPPLDDLQTDQGFSGPELDDAECSRWLEVFMRHRVMCLLFLGPLPCTLELQPFGEESEEAEPFQLQASPGSLVLVRADTLSHRVRQQLPQGIERAYCLSCFYSEDTASASRHPYRAQVSTPCTQALQQWMLQRLSAVKAAQQEGEDYMATAGRLQAQRKDTASAQGVPISEPVVRKVSEEEEKEELLEVKWTPLESPVSTAQLQGLGRVLFVGAGAELQEAIAPLFPGAEFSGAAEVVSDGCWDTVVFVAAVDDYEEIPEMDVLCAALKVAQACISLSETTAVSGSIEGGTGSRPLQWWITRGTQAVGPGGSYLNAGLWGMARTFRMEQPGLGLRCLDLGPNVLGSDAVAAELASWLGLLTAATGRTNVAGELDAVDAAGQPENEVAVRTSDSGEDQAFVARLTQSSTKLRRPMCLEMPSRGSLTNLRLAPQEKRRKPQEGQAEIRVRAIGLNFRDVLNVMGLYPGDPGHPGADTSGTVTATAADVSHIRCGDDVFGESLGCLNTYNTGTAALLTAKLASWSYEAASSIPVIFVTVEEPFADIAKVKKGDKVLIHAAAGGVGLVAIQYCQFVGAEVYATAGSEEKHAYLRSLGVKRITTTRDGQRFEDDMKRFLQEDEIDGIDVVLNSLTHDDYVGRSLRLLAHGGKFMEISKRDVWSHEEMRNARPDVLYTKIAADQMMFEEPWRFNAYLQRLLKRVEDGGLSHINMHIHEGLENAIAALQFLQKALNMGKVVISNPSMMGCRPDAAYVISGGTGSLGVVSAQFLVEEGAKFISLLTRSGRVVRDVQDKWEWLQASSATVQIRICDVSSRDSVGELARVLDSEGQVRRPPTLVGGVLHLAFLLDDAFIPDLTRKHLESTFAGKVFGARHLHDSFVQTSRALDFMVLFSSTSTVFGVPRQANYSAANASIDAHARVWRQRGESACSIQFGPWREVGLAVKIGAVGVLKSKGFGSLSNAFGMAALASCSLIAAPGSSSTIMANPMYWAKYLKQYAAVPPFFSEFSPGQAQPPELEARDALPVLPQWWQKAMNHVSFAGQSVAVSGAACKCPVGWKPDVWFRSLCAGTDFVVEVPASRWDHSQVYNPDPDGWKDYKTFCRHGAFMEGIELFDHRNFNVSKAEAVIMDPTQRSILEVGYEALCSAGYRKSSLFNCYGGVFLGAAVWNEWQAANRGPQDLNAFSSTATAGSIASNRVSFCLGLKGPSMTLDTGDSSGLVAVRLASEALSPFGASKTRGATAFALAGGARCLLSACQWPELQAAGRLTQAGRCLSFDASAAGCVLGEGIVALVLRSHNTVGAALPSQESPELGALTGSSVNHSGHSATLGAPSGSAEQEVVRDALRAAHLTPQDIDAVECHAQGSLLADAVEVMSLGRCLRAEQSDQSLDLLAVRPNGGNSQHACGLLGLLRVLSSLSWGFLAPTLHLRELSPLLGDLCDFPIDFITDHCDFRSSSSFVGVTARGFGTNVHAVVWGRLDETKRPSPESRVSRHGKLLFWPGGGGDLLDAEQPDLGYYIVGSWSSWSPEPMEEEEDGCFGFTVSLPQGTREAFQIWIDSNPGRALHPACTDASSGSAVHGPSSDHCDNTWLLQSRVIPQVHTGQEQSGFIVRQICDEFRIRLRVRGKWRLVDWQQVICGKEEEPCWDGADTAKVDTLVMAPATQPINSVYYVMGSPTSWAFEQMSCAGPGIYIAVLRLTTAACDFQIARNKDWEQVLHPSFPRAKLEDANPVLGPSGDGQGRYWRIDGQSDDLFRIELRHLVLCGKGVHEISWRRVMHKTWHAKR